MRNGVLARASVGLIAIALLLAACDSNQPGAAAPPAPRASTSPSKEAGSAPAARSQPNILLLLTDDQTFTDMKAMPKTLNFLSRSGTMFRRAYSSYPLCCPARVTLLTGQLAHNHGVMGNELPWGGATLFRDGSTLPVWLQGAGYNTMFLGKYLNGYPIAGDATYVPPGWDEWHAPVDGIYNYLRYLVNDNGELNEYHNYQTSYVQRRTSHLIKKYARESAPFFMWTGFLAPHGGLPEEHDDPRTLIGRQALDTPAVGDAHRDSMHGYSFPPKPSINEANMAEKGGLTKPPFLPRWQLQEVYEQRLESLRSVDDAIAEILAALRSTGELARTLVVFTSDNGFMVGEHRWAGKTLGYEESIHVPLIMAGPGVPRGATANQIVSLGDLTTTFLDVARASPGIPQDGVSLLPLSHDPVLRAHRSLLLEAGGAPFRHVPRLYTGVRTSDDMVLLRWWNGSEEVYDLKTDPYELNGAVSPEEKQALPRLRYKLAHLAQCAGPVCSSY